MTQWNSCCPKAIPGDLKRNVVRVFSQLVLLWQDIDMATTADCFLLKICHRPSPDLADGWHDLEAAFSLHGRGRS